MEQGQLRTGDESVLQDNKTHLDTQQSSNLNRDQGTPAFQWREGQGMKEVDKDQLGKSTFGGSQQQSFGQQSSLGQQSFGGQQQPHNFSSLHGIDTNRLGPPMFEIPGVGTVFAIGPPQQQQPWGQHGGIGQQGLGQQGLGQQGLGQQGLGQQGLGQQGLGLGQGIGQQGLGQQGLGLGQGIGQKDDQCVNREHTVKDHNDLNRHLRRLSFGQETPFVIENPDQELVQKMNTRDHILLPPEGQPQIMPIGAPIEMNTVVPQQGIPMQQSSIPLQQPIHQTIPVIPLPQQQPTMLAPQVPMQQPAGIFIPQQQMGGYGSGYGSRPWDRSSGFMLDRNGVMEANYRRDKGTRNQWWKVWNRRSRKNKNRGYNDPYDRSNMSRSDRYREVDDVFNSNRQFVPVDQYRQNLMVQQPGYNQNFRYY